MSKSFLKIGLFLFSFSAIASDLNDDDFICDYWFIDDVIFDNLYPLEEDWCAFDHVDKQIISPPCEYKSDVDTSNNRAVAPSVASMSPDELLERLSRGIKPFDFQLRTDTLQAIKNFNIMHGFPSTMCKLRCLNLCPDWMAIEIYSHIKPSEVRKKIYQKPSFELIAQCLLNKGKRAHANKNIDKKYNHDAVWNKQCIALREVERNYHKNVSKNNYNLK